MKKVVSFLAIVVAIAGVVVAKANESKILAAADAVYYNSGGAQALISSNPPSQFQKGISGSQAQIRASSGSNFLLYNNSSLNEAVYFVP